MIKPYEDRKLYLVIEKGKMDRYFSSNMTHNKRIDYELKEAEVRRLMKKL